MAVNRQIYYDKNSCWDFVHFMVSVFKVLIDYHSQPVSCSFLQHIFNGYVFSSCKERTELWILKKGSFKDYKQFTKEEKMHV